MIEDTQKFTVYIGDGFDSILENSCQKIITERERDREEGKWIASSLNDKYYTLTI